MFTLLIIGLWFGDTEPTNLIIDTMPVESFRECNQKGEDYVIPKDVDSITWICLDVNQEDNYKHSL